MPAGAPRTTSPPKEKVIELGKDLVEWIKRPKEKGEKPGDRLIFAEWYNLKHNMTRAEFDAICQLPEFRVYYEHACVFFARKINNSGKKDEISEGIAHRYMRYYVPEVRYSEDEKVEHAAKAKAQSDEEIIQKSIVEKDNLIIQQSKQLLDLQRQLDELKGKNDNSLQSQTD